VVLLSRGRRLADLRAEGLVLQDAGSGERTVLPVPCVSEIGAGESFDLVLVPVRAEQLPGTLPLLTAMTDGSDVLFLRQRRRPPG
jgi:ketopantoate reductase